MYSVRKLDFDPTQEIKERLKHVGNFKPIGIQKLKKIKKQLIDLYKFLKKLGIFSK